MAIITTEIKIPKRIVHVNGWPNRTCRKITNSGEICYLCCPNLLPLLPKLHLMNEIGKRCKRLPLKKWVFFFLFLLFSLRLCFFCLPLQTKFSSGGTATTKRHMTNSIMIKCWECNFGWAHPRKYLRCGQRWWTNRK